jgi:hypothetical protein
VFVLVSFDMLKAAPEINPNDITVLTMIVLYLLPPRTDISDKVQRGRKRCTCMAWSDGQPTSGSADVRALLAIGS